MTKQLSVYITNDQYDWLKLQPRTFNLSAAVRELFDTMMVGTELEVENTNEPTSTL